MNKDTDIGAGSGGVITQEYLKSRVSYVPETGIFNWINDVPNGARKDQTIGTKHGGGYLIMNFNRKLYLLHRLAWFYVHNEWPEQIDHINHDRTDNRLCNLRKVTNRANGRNKKYHNKGSSGLFGVSWNKRYAKWETYIGGNKKRVRLGLFEDFFEACCARKRSEIDHGYHENHGR